MKTPKYFWKSTVYTECGIAEGTNYSCVNCYFSTEDFSEIMEHIKLHKK